MNNYNSHHLLVFYLDLVSFYCLYFRFSFGFILWISASSILYHVYHCFCLIWSCAHIDHMWTYYFFKIKLHNLMCAHVNTSPTSQKLKKKWRSGDWYMCMFTYEPSESWTNYRVFTYEHIVYSCSSSLKSLIVIFIFVKNRHLWKIIKLIYIIIFILNKSKNTWITR